MAALVACVDPVSSQSLSLAHISSDHNGYNISCFGGGDGSIDLSVTGGTPPYTYSWSTGATTQDVADLRAGFISVLVRDAGTGQARADLTLTEPYELRADVEPNLYPSGFNISCHSCYNGSIQVTTFAGVAPYSYAWADGPTSEDRTQLDAGNYDVEITDANGCQFREDKILLTQPERDDWSKSGNAGTYPGTHFFGTSDNKDVVFKSNGVERFRLGSTGGLKLTALSGQGSGILKMDGNGFMSVVGFGFAQPPTQDPFWRTDGNFVDAQDGSSAFIGTKDNKAFIVRTNNIERLNVPNSGGLRIGAPGLAPKFVASAEGELRLQIAENGSGTPLTLSRAQGDYIRFERLADAGYWALHNGSAAQDHLAFHYTPATGPALMNRMLLHNDGHISFMDHQMMIHQSGTLGIGVASDASSLIALKRNQGDFIRFTRSDDAPGGGGGSWVIHNGNSEQNQLAFHYYPPTGDPLLNRLTLWNDGKVSCAGKLVVGDVSSASNDYTLFVQTGILTEKVKVAIRTTADWSDHVFAPAYRLMPLTELRRFIVEHRHLPGVPSAKVMVKEGLDVAKSDALLLEKIEELTLYILDLQTRMVELEAAHTQPK